MFYRVDSFDGFVFLGERERQKKNRKRKTRYYTYTQQKKMA